MRTAQVGFFWKKDRVPFLLGAVVIGFSCALAYDLRVSDEQWPEQATVTPQLPAESGTHAIPPQDFVPEAYNLDTRSPSAEPSLLLAAVGDLMLKDVPANALQHLAPLLSESELKVGNLECALTDRGSPVPEKPYTFRTADGAQTLLEAGFKVVSLANNHVWDYQWQGVEDTFAALNAAQILPVGFADPPSSSEAFITMKAIRIAFLGYAEDWLIWQRFWNDGTRGLNILDSATTVQEIQRIRAQGIDQIVVLLHWGMEGSSHAEDYQVEIAHQLVDVGATLILGSHSHRPQEIERYQGAVIAYNLGDCLFGDWTDPDCGLLLEVRLMKTGRVELEKVIGLSLLDGVSLPSP